MRQYPEYRDANSIINMESDDSEMSDNDQPPALEDADIDDVSSGASVVTESSASVSIQTEDEEDAAGKDCSVAYPQESDPFDQHIPYGSCCGS